jgi:hypothetical protein
MAVQADVVFVNPNSQTSTQDTLLMDSPPVLKNTFPRVLENMGELFFGKDNLEYMWDKREVTDVVSYREERMDFISSLLTTERNFLNEFFGRGPSPTSHEDVGVFFPFGIYDLNKMSLSNIYSKVCDLSIEDQKSLLQKAYTSRYDRHNRRLLKVIVKMIINNPSFREKEYNLSVIYAVKAGVVESLSELIEDPRAMSIPLNGNNSLAYAVHIASENGDEIVLRLLFEHPKSSDVISVVPSSRKETDEQWYSISGAICEASQKGHPKALEVLIGRPQASGINVNGEDSLAEAVVLASILGNVDVLCILLSHPEADKIALKGSISLSEAIVLSASNGNEAFLEMILDRVGCRDIDMHGTYGLETAMCKARGKSFDILVAYARSRGLYVTKSLEGDHFGECYLT